MFKLCTCLNRAFVIDVKNSTVSKKLNFIYKYNPWLFAKVVESSLLKSERALALLTPPPREVLRLTEGGVGNLVMLVFSILDSGLYTPVKCLLLILIFIVLLKMRFFSKEVASNFNLEGYWCTKLNNNKFGKIFFLTKNFTPTKTFVPNLTQNSIF